jgi:hypothetical protein
MSHLTNFAYTGDRYGLDLSHLVVEDNFIPEVGFVRRDNIRHNSAAARFSPRTRSIELIRRIIVQGQFDYIQNAETGILETKQTTLDFQTQFENSDRLSIALEQNYEYLASPFSIAPAVTIPVGGYNFSRLATSYSFGQQRPLSGSVTFATGTYWGGDGTSLSVTRGRFEVTPQFSVEPSTEINWINLPEGEFVAVLSRSRFSYSFNPRMFLSGLLQYNSSSNTLSTNFRLRWEYSPGSELFVVYTEDRDSNPLMPDRNTELRNRGFVVKINRLLQF